MNTLFKQSGSSTIVTVTVVLILFFLGIALIGWLALEQIRFSARYNTQQSLQTVLRTTQEAVYIWFDNRSRQIAKITRDPEFVEMAQALLQQSRDHTTLIEHPVQERIRLYSKPKLAEMNDLGIFIIAPDSISVASMRDENIGIPNLIAKNYPKLLERAFLGEVCLIPTIVSDVPLPDRSGRLVERAPTLFIASPIRDLERDEVIAVFTIRIDPSKDFTRIMQLGRIGESGETYAINSHGVMISESRFDHHLQMLGLMTPEEKGILKVRVADPGVNLTTGAVPETSREYWPLTKMAAMATSGRSGFDVYGYRDYRGVEVFGAWQWDEKLGFALVTEIDAAEALQPFYTSRLIVAGILIGASILTLFLLAVILVLQNRSAVQLKKAYAELEERIRLRTLDLENAKAELAIANRELQSLATMDELTGLGNRRRFDFFLDREWRRCRRKGTVISLGLIDIDYFKPYNDTYGHLGGDECLRKIGAIFQNSRFLSRPGDLIARYGGEEFAVIMSDTDQDEALYVLEKVAEAVRAARIPHTGTKVKDVDYVTLSAGLVSDIPQEGITLKTFIRRADQALYQAKNQGRNRVVVFGDKGCSD